MPSFSVEESFNNKPPSLLSPIPSHPFSYSSLINKYLLLAEFSVRTVNYGSSFFPSIYGPSAKRAGHKSTEKNEEMAKKLVKMIGCRHVCYHICRTNYSFSHRQNISNLCQSIFLFLTVYYDKIFKH